MAGLRRMERLGGRSSRSWLGSWRALVRRHGDEQTKLCVRDMALLGGLALAGCAAAPVGREDLFAFLTDGVTRRDEVVLRLGQQYAENDQSRVLAYRLGRDKRGYVVNGRGWDWTGMIVRGTRIDAATTKRAGDALQSRWRAVSSR
jgi:hypothetical protein